MADRKEAQRLWGLILQLEAQSTKTEAEFNSKRREMEKLRAAYARASGTSASPRAVEENAAIGRAGLMGSMGLGRPDGVTGDDLP